MNKYSKQEIIVHIIYCIYISKGLGVGAIIDIVVGAFVIGIVNGVILIFLVLIAIIALVLFLFKKRMVSYKLFYYLEFSIFVYSLAVEMINYDMEF